MRLAVAVALLAAPVALAFAGCGSRVLLGSDTPPPDPACKHMMCGDPCPLPACSGDMTPDCGAPQMEGHCDPGGACVSAPPTCPPPVPPCENKMCGDACDLCAGNPSGGGGGSPCPPGACNAQGACVEGPVMCPCAGPDCTPACAGALCGKQCNPCEGMMDGGCMPPPPPLPVCDGMGRCVEPLSAMCMPMFVPCEMKMCGDMCALCDPANPGCTEPPGPRACDPMGQCQPQPVMCP